MIIREDLRNIAIIAHVDHGKTTLVNEMLKQGGIFRSNQHVADRVMDSGDLERERGITILAKNTAAYYKNTKINIIDTPGHADFSGEVERILKMVNGVLLLVDAYEGPMPQTRFVLQKALELGHKVILVINKIDRPDAEIDRVYDEIIDLLIDLGANDEQLDSPVIYCSARQGTATTDLNDPKEDLKDLFEKIIDYFDAPKGEEKGPLQMLVSSIDYNDFVGRIGIGRIERGVIKLNQDVTIADFHNAKPPYKARITKIFQIDGLKRVPVNEGKVGDIVCIAGVEGITIGDTICDVNCVEPIEFVKIGLPTLEMRFSVNDSPFAGQEGKYVTSRHLKDRLYKELLKDVSLHVEDTDSTDTFIVKGRGEMHLSILIETMRREGYEFSVSMPRVLYKHEDGVLKEPMEKLIIDVPEQCIGSIMQDMGVRKGELVTMSAKGSRTELEFRIPARGLIGYKNDFLTETRGEGIMSSIFDGYDAYRGDIQRRTVGSLVASDTGEAVTYGLYNAQERGALFIGAGVQVYEGMVVGCSPKADDLVINVCKQKKLTNTRASGSDEALRLTTPKKMSLEDMLEFLSDDELLEVTPKSLRIRKTVLSGSQRMKIKFGKKSS